VCLCTRVPVCLMMIRCSRGQHLPGEHEQYVQSPSLVRAPCACAQVHEVQRLFIQGTVSSPNFNKVRAQGK
jgi:hypothetical protein